jgi:hypothetical protein
MGGLGLPRDEPAMRAAPAGGGIRSGVGLVGTWLHHPRRAQHPDLGPALSIHPSSVVAPK